MFEAELLVTDVLVIGSGIAGMMAALEARRAGAEVALVSSGNLGKESSTSVARSFSAHCGEGIEAGEIPGYDNKVGKYIEDWPLVRTINEEAPKQIENLIRLGVPLVRTSSSGDSDRIPSWSAKGGENTHGGAIVLDILVPVVRGMGVRAVEGCHVVGLLKDEDRIVGASGLLRDGRWLSVYGRAVILASGGAAGMSEVTAAPREVTGSGYAMALRAGLPLKNMEFNRFYPVGLPTPAGQHVHCAPLTLMMERARLRNDRGEDIIRKHFGISLQQGVSIYSIKAEWFPRAVAMEMEEGKVWLDLTQVSSQEWDRLPERNWKQIRRTQVDMKKTPLPIRPMSIGSTGGLLVNVRMQTPMKGLYAAGEVAAGWVDRLRGLSFLSCCLALGAIAGRNAAVDIEGEKIPPAKAVDEGLEEAQSLAAKVGEGSPEEMGEEIRRVVYRCAGPVKSGPSLGEGLRKLQTLDGEVARLRCTSPAELKRALEVKAMLLTSQAMMKAALFRTESRNGFYRRDFPARNDEQWLRPILVSHDPETGEVRVAPGKELAPGELQ